MTLEQIRLAITDFLNLPIIINSLISIDFWSIIHLIAGALIFILLTKYIKNKSKQFLLTTLFILLFLWEIFEFANYGILKNNLFLPEIITNLIWDLILGMLGGLITLKLKP